MKSKLLKAGLLLIAAVMIVSIAFAGAASADATNTTITNWCELNENISNWNDNPDGMLTIILSSFDSSDAEDNVNIEVSSNITIRPAENPLVEEITLDAKQEDRLFNVKKEGEKEGNLTLTGSATTRLNLTGGYTDDIGGGIYVNEYGKLTLLNGAMITYCINEGKEGGGIYVTNNGKLTLSNGAVIANCTTTDKGGGVYFRGTFNMSDGAVIANCTADEDGGGVYVGGVGIFHMSNGAMIMFCRAGSEEENEENGQGGGVYVYEDGRFTMSDGAVITNCTAKDSGGGVYAEGRFNMSDGAVITNCTADRIGGGVYVQSIFNMSNGAMITNCTAGIGGGGVYFVYREFTMVGSRITGCSAPRGGAVALNQATFIMKDSSVEGNNASWCSGVDNYRSTFNISGTTTIPEDNDVGLNTKKMVTPLNIDDSDNQFTGHIYNITLYSDEPSKEGAEDPADWVGKIVVINGSKYIDSFRLSSNYFKDYHLEAGTGEHSNDLYLRKGATNCTIKYDGNGNTSGSVPVDPTPLYIAGSTVTVLDNTGSLEKTGKTFDGWNTKNDGTGTNYTAGSTFKIYVNTTLYAKWNDVPSPTPTPTPTPYTPSHKESGQTVIQQSPIQQEVSKDPTPANQATADITVKYVGQSVLGTSTADTAALKEQYPEAAAQVELSFALAMEAGIPLTNSKGAKAVVVTDQNIPGVEKVTFSRVYEISPANAGEKLTKVTVKVPKSDITAKGLTPDDVTVYHFLESYNLWVPLETISKTEDDINYYYTAATDGTSPFGVLVKKIGEIATPTANPTTQPTQKSPAPFVGLIAGLGAALVIARLRK